MIKYIISVLTLSLIFIAMLTFADSNSNSRKTFTNQHYLVQNIGKVSFSNADTSNIPEEIQFPSTVGEVSFPHLFHIEDLEMECVDCHHQINADILVTPHPSYFKSSWINCEICHNESGEIKQKIFTCSKCHHPSPVTIADETLSSKVVIHKNCWKCHEVSTGIEASETCGICHSGVKKKS